MSQQLVRKSKKNSHQGAKGSPYPPSRNQSIVCRTTIRYIANANFSAGLLLNVNDIMEILGVMAQAAPAVTGGFRVCDSVRIRSIEMWAQPVPTATVPTLISIESLGSNYLGGPSRVKQDMGMGQARPAHLHWKPEPGTQAAQWFTSLNLNGGVIQLKCPAACVMDVTYDIVMADGNTAPYALVTNWTSSAVQGQIYARPFAVSSGGAGFPAVSILSL